MAPFPSRYRTASFLLGSLAAAGGIGAMATTPLATVVMAALAATVILTLLLERFGSGCAAGLLILAGLDALPGPNLETTRVANSITAQDIAVAALMFLLLYRNLRGDYRVAQSTVWGRRANMWGIVFLLWYAFVILRTWESTPVPLVHAITFTRDFPYFALLLVLLIGPFRDRTFRVTTLVTLAIGALVAALAQTTVVAGHVSLAILVHTYQQGQSSGLTRLYTSAADIPFAGLPLGLGLFLFGSSPPRRAFGAVVGLASLTAVVLGLTRAMYVGETVGLTVAILVTLLSGDAVARVGRQQLAKAALAIALAAGAVAVYSPPSTSTLTGVSQRATSVFSALGGTSTGVVDRSLQTRQLEISSIETAIGSKWPIGLGALDPTYDYVSNVPFGNVRSPDVSLLGGVAAIGVIGVVIYALPLFSLLFGLLASRLRTRGRHDDDWLAFGGLAWCVAAVVASPTLGFFFNPAQVVGSATVLALVLVLLTERVTSQAPVATKARTRSDVAVQQIAAPGGRWSAPGAAF